MPSRQINRLIRRIILYVHNSALSSIFHCPYDSIRQRQARNDILNHVNSEPRESLGNKTPFDLFIGKNEKKLLDLLNLHPVPPDKVMLSPKLLNLKNPDLDSWTINPMEIINQIEKDVE